MAQNILLQNSLILVCAAIAGLSLVVLACVVGFEFFELQKKETSVKNRAAVAIVAMGGFFLLELILGQRGIGMSGFSATAIDVLAIIGCVISVLGVALNLIARVQLGSSWSNNIVIYKDHSLVKTGLYSQVRHPLYSSILLIAFGLAVLYSNYLSLLLTIIIFIPLIRHRALSEEAVMRKHLAGYEDYAKITPMFIPPFMRVFFSEKLETVDGNAIRFSRILGAFLLTIAALLYWVFHHPIGSWVLVGFVLISSIFGAYGYCLGAYIYFGLRKLYRRYSAKR